MRQLMIRILALCLLTGYALAQNDFLKPEEAFKASASAQGKSLKVSWVIAPKHYLYQNKIRFTSDTPGVIFGEPKMPEGVIKQDQIFGDIEVYRDKVDIIIPLKSNGTLPDLLTLQARSQGCADAGLCYPPRTEKLVVALAQFSDQPMPVDKGAAEEAARNLNQVQGSGSSSSAAPQSNPVNELAALGDILGLEDDGILSPEEAFQFTASVQDANHLQLHWTIADETYLYHEKVQLSIQGDGVTLAQYELPAPKIKSDGIKPDGTMGDVAVYVHNIDLSLPLARTNTAATSVKLLVKYQGCADRGICYPPQKKTIELQLPAADASNILAAPLKTASSATEATEATELSEQDEIATLLQGGNTWLILSSFFGIGLLLAFTPCVFPMIPILSGIIAGHGSTITTRKAFTLSLVYVLAMAATYTVAGVLAGLFGSNIQAAFQNPWILSAFAALFVLLAFSMFGFYELQLPSSWQAKLTEVSNKQQGGHLTGVAVMGLLSALIVGPCVAPPLAGALIFIGQTGDGLLGGLALFAMAMGMGAPLIVIGTSAGKFLPKAGAWMDAVKAVFGVTMLGLAIYMLERIIPEAAAMLLWGLLLVASAIYMGALKQLSEDSSGWHKLWKGLGLALLIYGALFLVGAAAGGKDTLQPLRGLLVGGGSAQAHVQFKRIKTTQDLQRELQAAKTAGKPVMLDFYADWCVYCKQMEKNTFPDPKVRAALDGFVLLQADVTDQDEADMLLQSEIGIPAPPAMIFWDAAGTEHKNLRMLGFMNAEDFAKHVNRL